MKADFNHLEGFRHRGSGFMATRTGDRFGSFQIPFTQGASDLVCIVSDGGGDEPEIQAMPRWEHVSLRAHSQLTGESRVPTWEEMSYAKSLFWEDEECVMQLHPPKSSYVNRHPHVLHLWRPLFAEIPQPPTIMVG